jgi:hypothetical protein
MVHRWNCVANYLSEPWVKMINYNRFLSQFYNTHFDINFSSYFERSFWHRFWSFLDPIFEHQIWPHFSTFLGGGSPVVKNHQNWGSQNVTFCGFCYIVVSTFFGPSGPPPGHPFWTRFWEKYSLFVGTSIFIGSILGVKKGGSFCRKLQNFKKFINLTPPDPPGRFWSFLALLDPPMACQFLSNFRPDFDPPIFDKFSSFLIDFMAPIFDHQFWSIFHLRF